MKLLKRLLKNGKKKIKNKYLESLKNTITDEEELKKKLESVKQEDLNVGHVFSKK